MQVNANIYQPRNNFLNVEAINRNFQSKDQAAKQAGKDQNRDKVNLSPQGKMMSAIENLTKQKETIVRKRNELIGKTLENGGDMEAIETQLEAYDEQLTNLEKQIAQITADQMKEAVEKEEEKKKTEKADEHKTEEQIETEKLTKIASVTQDIKSAEIASSTKSKVEGEARVKKTEVKRGELQIDDLKSKHLTTGANVKDMISNIRSSLNKKESVIAELKGAAIDLEGVQGESLNEAIKKLNESGKPAEGSEKDPAKEAESVAKDGAVSEEIPTFEESLT